MEGAGESLLMSAAVGFMGLLPVAVVLYVVIKRDKTVSAFVQLGSLQRRQEAMDELADRKKMDAKATMKLGDKMTFTIGVINCILTPYLFGAFPTKFYLWYTPKAVLLIFVRWYTFREQKKHYLLFDFCYWANFLTLFYLWVLPKNHVLFQIVFLCANGPLAWATLTFAHSLIFHSRPHITSVFIHTSPMVLSHALRFFPSDEFHVCPGADGLGATLAEDPQCRVSGARMVYVAMTRFYLWWLVMYYLWIFLILAPRIERRGLQTLYDRVTTKGPLKPILGSFDAPPLVKKAVYMLCHLVFAGITMALSIVYFDSQLLHMLFIAAVMSSTAWNASDFYFNVFSRTYEESLIARISVLPEVTVAPSSTAAGLGPRGGARARDEAKGK